MSLLNSKVSKKPPRKNNKLEDIIKEEKTSDKFTLNMPINLHREFKAHASKEGRRMSDIIISLIISYLKSKSK